MIRPPTNTILSTLWIWRVAFERKIHVRTTIRVNAFCSCLPFYYTQTCRFVIFVLWTISFFNTTNSNMFFMTTNHEIRRVFVFGQVHFRPTLLCRASEKKTIFPIRMTVEIAKHVRSCFHHFCHVLQNPLKTDLSYKSVIFMIRPSYFSFYLNYNSDIKFYVISADSQMKTEDFK